MKYPGKGIAYTINQSSILSGYSSSYELLSDDKYISTGTVTNCEANAYIMATFN